MTPIPARWAGAALASLAVAAVPAAAAAATLHLDRSCYTRNQTVRVSGGGYPPNQTQTLLLNGQPFPNQTTLTANATGRISGRFLAPAPFRPATSMRTYTLTASAASPPGSPIAARTTFQVVHTNIQTTPPFITPGFVTYRALGFTSGHSLYVHYLRGTRHVTTKRIGTLSGPCGTLTKRVRMFLFRPVKAGLYTLIFDNSARYSSTYRPDFSFLATVPYTFT